MADAIEINPVAPRPVELPEVVHPRLPAEPWPDSLLTWAGSTLDGAVLRAMRVVVDAIMMPRPEDLSAMRAAAQLYTRGVLWDEPRRFFSFVETPLMPLEVRSRHRRAIEGGVVTAHSFDTAYEPYDTTVDSAAQATDACLVEHWTHEPDSPRATVVTLHGFSMGYPRLDAFALFADPCFRAGYDVALVTLPFHGARTPATARFSGERFAAPHVAQLNEAVRRAVYEIHMIVGWLQRHTSKPVGLLGLSLGGYLSALVAGLRGDLAFAIPMVPPVCMGDLAWRFVAASRANRDAAFTRHELRRAYRVHSPLTYARRIDRARILILAGRGDQIVPPDHPHTLWRHWDEPSIHWFSGSHLAPFGRGRLATRILQHIEDCVA